MLEDLVRLLPRRPLYDELHSALKKGDVQLQGEV